MFMTFVIAIDSKYLYYANIRKYMPSGHELLTGSENNRVLAFFPTTLMTADVSSAVCCLPD
jgi:hypothetical protein